VLGLVRAFLDANVDAEAGWEGAHEADTEREA
jgi:hypothetical protein